MTEREYILATNIRALDCAINALSTIVPSDDTVVSQPEFGQVLRALDKWRDASRRLIRVRESPTETSRSR